MTRVATVALTVTFLSVSASPVLLAQSTLSEARAKEIMQQDGYTDIRDLKQAENGWHAVAKESGKEVSLIADPILGIRKEIPRGP